MMGIAVWLNELIDKAAQKKAQREEAASKIREQAYQDEWDEIERDRAD